MFKSNNILSNKSPESQLLKYSAYTYFFLNIVIPGISAPTNNIMNMVNKILAMDAAPVAIPVNPKTAAIIAITKKIADHLSIGLFFKLL